MDSLGGSGELNEIASAVKIGERLTRTRNVSPVFLIHMSILNGWRGLWRGLRVKGRHGLRVHWGFNFMEGKIRGTSKGFGNKPISAGKGIFLCCAGNLDLPSNL